MENSDFLPFAEPDAAEDDDLRYGSLVLRAAAKDGKANTLLADQFFSPSLLLAEQIERGLVDLEGCTVVEIGAGAALPSILAACREKPPSLITITDHPDETIINNLRENIERNRPLFSPSCQVKCLPYIWGEDSLPILEPLKHRGSQGYDFMILSDLLYFDASHDALVKSVELLLSRRETSRAYVGAGMYTPPAVCAKFIAIAEKAGLEAEEQTAKTQTPEESMWRGQMNVVGMTLESLAARKANVRWWMMKWKGF
ncbi:hypothetical protein DL93DRAFT_2076800 [Clavulina sp. PMI_390]|nr:hypothetical protein DL93DRAFT_2076800 [Clavulina sp. PMI_390]